MLENTVLVKLHQFILNKPRGRFAIYGTGSGAIKVVASLGVLFEQIECFIDRDIATEKLLYYKPVHDLSYLKNEFFDGIIIASMFGDEITKKLKNVGVLKNSIFLCFSNESKNQNEINIDKYTYGVSTNNTYSKLVEKIGAFCSINSTAIIGTLGNHPIHLVSTHPFFYNTKFGFVEEKDDYVTMKSKNGKIKIGNDVWVGSNAIILPGVTIGNGAIIGAGSVVTRDVPSYAIVVGNPARILKYRFSEETIKKIEKIAWWEWDDDKIKENIQLFKYPELFIEKHYKNEES